MPFFHDLHEYEMSKRFLGKLVVIKSDVAQQGDFEVFDTVEVMEAPPSAIRSLKRSVRPCIRSLDIHAFGQDEVEIEARLAATSIDGKELDAIVERLAALPTARQVF